MTLSQSILFYRDFIRASGGHQKVYDYFQHLVAHRRYRPSISFSDESLWNSTNPWFPEYQGKAITFRPSDFDCLILAGMDWNIYRSVGIDIDLPVVNLIQHVRHAESEQPMHEFLAEKAIRICVSPEVKEAILSTGKVNGPVFVIPNGVGVPKIERPKSVDFFIAGLKRPHMAGRIQTALHQQGHSVDCLRERIPRAKFLERLASTKIAIMLPAETEGFYLPAIEAMHLADLVVVPDCIGNRSFCFDHQEANGNCFFTSQQDDSIILASQAALNMLEDGNEMSRIQNNAALTVEQHSLAREREAFYEVMDQVETLWKSI